MVWLPSYLNFLFSPQAHKVTSGYFINHDTLMSGKLLLMQFHLKLDLNLFFTSLPNRLLKE